MHKGARSYRPLPTVQGELRPQSSPVRKSRSRSPSVSVVTATITNPNHLDRSNAEKLLIAEVAEASPVRRLGYMDPTIQYFDHQNQKKRQALQIEAEKRREEQHRKEWEDQTKEVDLSPSSLAAEYRQNGARHRANSFMYTRKGRRDRALKEKEQKAQYMASLLKSGGGNAAGGRSSSSSFAGGANSTLSRSSSQKQLLASSIVVAGSGGGTALLWPGGLNYEVEFERLFQETEAEGRVPPPPRGPPTFVIVAASSKANSEGNVPVTLAQSFDRARAAASGIWKVPKYSGEN
jgi:hypothetical protein